MKDTAHRTPGFWLAAASLLLLPLVLVVPTDADAATTRVRAITSATATPTVAFQAFDGNPVKLFDINGDGNLEIIAQNDNQYVYIFDSKTGALLAELTTKFPSGWGARSFNGPEVAVVSGDGKIRLIVENSAAHVTQFRYDPAASTTDKFAFVKEWDRRLTDCHSNPGADSKPTLYDLDKDGSLDIILGTEELGVYALRIDGTLLWKTCIGGGNAEPVAADLNGDGWAEVIHASDAGIVTVLNGLSGAHRWTYNAATAFKLGSGSMPVGPTIAQVDGVGGLDVVVGARDSHDAEVFTNNHALLLALDSNGKLLWGRQDPQANPLTYTHPMVVDADGDGTNEVYWGDWNTMGHKPPIDPALAFKRLGPAHFYRYSNTGSLVWRQTLDTWWSNKDLALADVDADGVQEVLANGPNSAGHDGIWYLDSRTGAKEVFVDVSPHQLNRGPVIADLWSAGTMQWVVEVASPHGILIYDTGVAYSSLWPHLPYPPKPVQPPPPKGFFGALFTIKSPNAWWQEVTVKPDTARTITSVEVQIRDGAWIPMTKSSWGAWTSSHNTPAGTKVEFRAWDSGQKLSTSLPFTWMDGTLSKRSVESDTTPPPTTTTSSPTTPPPTTLPSTTLPPPTTSTTPTSTTPPSAFGATYRLSSGVNEWWVEVFVTANQPLSGVDARVNNGAWIPLEKKTWGAWAKSFFVDTGSNVQFRSTSTTGSQNLSQVFKWLVNEGEPFTATFTPKAVGNDWWVEVQVVGSRAVTKVEANVNSGSWIVLDKQSWGNWAKSFFVPNGSQVRFRATADNGEMVISGPTTWT